MRRSISSLFDSPLAIWSIKKKKKKRIDSLAMWSNNWVFPLATLRNFADASSCQDLDEIIVMAPVYTAW